MRIIQKMSLLILGPFINERSTQNTFTTVLRHARFMPVIEVRINKLKSCSR